MCYLCALTMGQAKGVAAWVIAFGLAALAACASGDGPPSRAGRARDAAVAPEPAPPPPPAPRLTAALLDAGAGGVLDVTSVRDADEPEGRVRRTFEATALAAGGISIWIGGRAPVVRDEDSGGIVRVLPAGARRVVGDGETQLGVGDHLRIDVVFGRGEDPEWQVGPAAPRSDSVPLDRLDRGGESELVCRGRRADPRLAAYCDLGPGLLRPRVRSHELLAARPMPTTYWLLLEAGAVGHAVVPPIPDPAEADGGPRDGLHGPGRAYRRRTTAVDVAVLPAGSPVHASLSVGCPPAPHVELRPGDDLVVWLATVGPFGGRGL